MSSTERVMQDLPEGAPPAVPSLAAMGMELRTRDADAHIYESFFTDFQTQVELRTYTGAFAGRTGWRGLEVGCGTGRTLGALTAPTVVGIDLSREELLVARQRVGAHVTLVQASATHLPFRSGVFDQVLCAGMLHHLPDDTLRTLTARELARVSAPGARVVVGTHSYSWVVQRMFPKDTINHALYWHRFTASELEGLLKRMLEPCRIKTRAICHLPRWRVGNRLGRFGVWLDGLLSRVPGLKHVTGVILVAEIDRSAAS